MDYILEYLNKLSDDSRNAHVEEFSFDERCISTPFMSLPFTPVPYESLPFCPSEEPVFYEDENDDDDEIVFPDFLFKATSPAHL